MIFVTVGAQMHFDRLIRAVDEWAYCRNRSDVFAQIGSSNRPPQHMQWTRFLPPGEFRQTVGAARVLVAHAGTGSILTALELGKPIVVMPRRAHLRETRNDHQYAMALKFSALEAVSVALDEDDLAKRLDEIDLLAQPRPIRPWASDDLLEAVRCFVAGTSPDTGPLSQRRLPDPTVRLERGRIECAPGAGLHMPVARQRNVGGLMVENAMTASESGNDWLVIMLAGALHPSPLQRELNLPPLCLPMSRRGTLLDCWIERFAEAKECRQIWIVVNDEADALAIRQISGARLFPNGGPEITVMAEPAPWRGTGGLVRDLADGVAAGGAVLVAEAHRVPCASVTRMIQIHAARGEGVVAVTATNEPAGLYLFERAEINRIPDIGYYDLKEQFLPALRKQNRPVRSLKVVDRSIRIRSRQTYLAAVAVSLGPDGSPHRIDPGASISASARLEGRCVIESGAVVEDGSVLQDSVILRGAIVERGAIVSRSIVVPGARVAPGELIVDRIVADRAGVRAGRRHTAILGR